MTVVLDQCNQCQRQIPSTDYMGESQFMEKYPGASWYEYVRIGYRCHSCGHEEMF